MLKWWTSKASSKSPKSRSEDWESSWLSVEASSKRLQPLKSQWWSRPQPQGSHPPTIYPNMTTTMLLNQKRAYLRPRNAQSPASACHKKISNKKRILHKTSQSRWAPSISWISIRWSFWIIHQSSNNKCQNWTFRRSKRIRMLTTMTGTDTRSNWRTA